MRWVIKRVRNILSDNRCSVSNLSLFFLSSDKGHILVLSLKLHDRSGLYRSMLWWSHTLFPPVVQLIWAWWVSSEFIICKHHCTCWAKNRGKRHFNTALCFQGYFSCLTGESVECYLLSVDLGSKCSLNSKSRGIALEVLNSINNTCGLRKLSFEGEGVKILWYNLIKWYNLIACQTQAVLNKIEWPGLD